MCVDKVLDDDDNGYNSLHGWGIKILTGQRSFCALLETMQT
jgi:hypothetical protein